ncbi:hypothetical protein PGT21_020196 [Puccinia graminis f. sp. tritici]|uniref:Uncharacterized protein n=1 Tax=Puccinia graminis f. sp. tritici TaxID=56615 RepID=A0A5B0NAT5_PUCGR|nr:hypothetical protein PGT21_020196 [Puccinia graminis f. sp. tritici]KAA1112157.1 hypothetical protein PGTUg99_012283 [Puccinia graminis f. sp. tritici]
MPGLVWRLPYPLLVRGALSYWFFDTPHRVRLIKMSLGGPYERPDGSRELNPPE